MTKPTIDVEATMASIKDKSRLIEKALKAFETGKSKTHADALALQALKMERSALQGLLPPLTVVS